MPKPSALARELARLLFCLGVPLGLPLTAWSNDIAPKPVPATAAPASAETAPPRETEAPTADPALQLHQKGQYADAAAVGLSELLTEPWNHELRFLVADSLQRSGKFDEAIMQFEALDGTPLSASAAMRLNALRGGGTVQKTEAGPLPGNTDRPAATMRRKTTAPARTSLAATEPAGQTAQMATPPTQPAPSTQAQAPAADAKTRPSLRAKVILPQRNPAIQRLFDLSATGNYAAIANEGPAVLKTEANDDELRLLVANSLAWTGKLDEAIVQYQALLKGQFGKQASIGLGNVYHWRGQDSEALPLFRAVLAQEPKNPDASEGLRLALRETRPRTTLGIGEALDSSHTRRRQATVTQRWRTPDGKGKFEVETGGVNDQIETVKAKERDLTLRYQALNLLFQPRLELGVEGTPARSVFGGVRLNLDKNQTYLEADRVNWGKLASNARALADHLTAAHVGLTSTQQFGIGEVGLRADYYSISDNNAILATTWRYVPPWRPLGTHFKTFAGIDTRDGHNAAPNNAYWSPVTGYGALYAGAMAEGGGANWSLFVSGQGGARLYGEAGANWSLSLGGQFWLGDDIALGWNLWKMASRREGAAYRAKSAVFTLEKLWN